MGFLERLFGQRDEDVRAYSTIDLARDTGFPDYMTSAGNLAGASVNRRSVMRNPAVKRCINLLSNSVAMLPLHLLLEEEGGQKEKATKHPLFDLLGGRPNTWQNAFQFKKLMQRRALIDGDAFAMILRGTRGVTSLVPLADNQVRVEQKDDWSVIYRVQQKTGGERIIQSQDMFHLYGDSDNGYSGIALLDEAADALGISLQADKAAARLFKHGAIIRDTLSTDRRLSPEAIVKLKSQLEEQYSGAHQANKTLVLEEGLKYEGQSTNARESQHLETRAHQIEEVARIFGVPRPFLMMDDTSWGSGIEQLGIFLVQYGLAPWFVAWEQAINRTLLTDEDRRQGIYAKFNERALLRGSMKDQADFFSKMMGAGGSPQIMQQNEARALLDLPEHEDGFGLIGGAVNGGLEDGTTGQDQAQR
jgi:HK97 family phage portal protein